VQHPEPQLRDAGVAEVAAGAQRGRRRGGSRGGAGREGEAGARGGRASLVCLPKAAARVAQAALAQFQGPPCP
jgi:hypothetical protein